MQKKTGKRIYFYVGKLEGNSPKYYFDMIINGLDGEYTVTAEAIGNNGKTYSERLWIPGNQRKEISKQEMNTTFKTEEGKIIFRKKAEPKYVIRTNTYNIEGMHINDGRDYITGNAEIFLRREDGAVEIPKEVKIYVEKSRKENKFLCRKTRRKCSQILF